MAIYKPNMLDKFKDFVNGLKANWDDYETHKAESAYSGLRSPNVSGFISGNVNYYKSYGIVTFSITHSTLINPLPSYGNIELFTLPEGFRPAMQVFFPLAFDNQESHAVVRIYPEGRFQILSRQSGTVGDIPTNVAFRGSGSFAVEQ